jgi:hypothetical protein
MFLHTYAHITTCALSDYETYRLAIRKLILKHYVYNSKCYVNQELF